MQHAVFTALTLAFMGTACQPASPELTDAARAAIADSVTQLANGIFGAYRGLDIERALSMYSSELVWAENGSLTTNRDSLASVARDMTGSFQSLAGDWEDMHVNVLGPNSAVVTARFEANAIDTTGAQTTFRGVWTAVFARGDEGWKIVYGHESSPPESM